MKKITGYAYVLFALATIAIGIIQIAAKNFNRGLLPVPERLPGRMAMLYTTATVLISAGACLFIRKWRYRASVVLGFAYLVLFIGVHLFNLLGNLNNPNEWTASVEVLSLCSGAFIIADMFSYRDNRPIKKETGLKKIQQVARYLFSFSLIVFAILHFKYAEFIATLIPAWIPARVFLALLIGIGFLSSAVSIVIQRFTRVATVTLGTMFLSWVFILHLPRALAKMTDEPEWTSLFVALAFSAISYTIAFLTTQRNRTFVRRNATADMA